MIVLSKITRNPDTNADCKKAEQYTDDDKSIYVRRACQPVRYFIG